MGDLVPTHLTVQCLCKKHVNIRTKESNKVIPCWNCNRSIVVHLGEGKNNVRVTIEGRVMRLVNLDQG